jgi:DNA-binding NtrC family response regulator
VTAAAEAAVPQAAGAPPVEPLAEQVGAVERRAIAEALRATRGNRVAAAKLLRMSRAALYDRLGRYPELELIE